LSDQWQSFKRKIEDTKDKASNKFNAKLEQKVRAVEILGRKIGVRFFEKPYRELIDQHYQSIMDTPENSPAFIDVVLYIAKLWMGKRESEINYSQGKVPELSKSDEACIYIMNHDYQDQDPALMATFMSLLYRDYKALGKAASCPRPKVILNEDILNTHSEKVRNIFEKAGAVGVDPSLYLPKESAKSNLKRMLPVIQGFIQDKCNVFIFPEGKLSAFRNLDLFQRFQEGIGDLIRTVANKKNRVKVVPLGMAYNRKAKKDRLGSLFVGKPIYFKKQGNQMLVSPGNALDDTSSPLFKALFPKHAQQVSQKEGRSLLEDKRTIETFTREGFVPIGDEFYKPITQNQQPVANRDVASYIAGILCEDLRICRDQAIKQLPETPKGDQSEIKI
jgi:hypothetical protein